MVVDVLKLIFQLNILLLQIIVSFQFDVIQEQKKKETLSCTILYIFMVLQVRFLKKTLYHLDNMFSLHQTDDLYEHKVYSIVETYESSIVLCFIKLH